MDILTVALGCLALCVPAASVLFAASAWQSKLAHPRMFIVTGLALLYVLACYLMTRPIQTHAVVVGADGWASLAVQATGSMLKVVALTLCELVVASVVVVFALRRVMSRKG